MEMYRKPHRLSFISGALLLLSFFGICNPSFAQQAEEYALKASFIQRFVQFIKWPAEVPADSSVSLEIGIIGQGPFKGQLEEVFANLNDPLRSLQVKKIEDISDIQSCDLLFISNSETERLHSILDITATKPVLTIGDSEGFCQAGVIINFYIDGDRLHFKININAARKSGLEIDPFLLDYAKIVDSSDGTH